MLLSALFPIVDTRPFATVDAGVLPLPSWPSPEIDEEFLHFFGSIQRSTSAARPRGSPGDGRACSLKRAVRPRSSPVGRLVGERGDDPFRWVFRELWSDGKSIVRVDLGVACPDEALAGVGRGLQSLIDGWARLSLDIHASKRGEPIDLRHAGIALAPIYARATTERAKRPEIQAPWVVAGQPCFFAAWSAKDAPDKTGVPPLISAAPGVRIGRAPIPSSGPRAAIFYIEHEEGAEAQDAARRLRADLAELHLTRECLWLVLRQIAAGQISPTPKPRMPKSPKPESPTEQMGGPKPEEDPKYNATNAMQGFLTRATAQIDELRGVLPSIAFGDPRDPRAGDETRDDGVSFSETLKQQLTGMNVRGNVTNKLVAHARLETGEAAPGPKQHDPGGIAQPIDIMPFVLEPPDSAPELPAADLRVRAELAAMAREAIEPNTIVRFLLHLGLDAPSLEVAMPGANLVLPISLERGVAERELTATVSSIDFARPAGETWTKVFKVRRGDLDPSDWSFAAKAQGERREYELRVLFSLGSAPAGEISIKLPRRPEVRVEPSRAVLAAAAEASRFTIELSHSGTTTHIRWFSPRYDAWEEPFSIDFQLDDLLTSLSLASYQRLADLRDYLSGIVVSLDRSFVRALRTETTEQQGVLIRSKSTSIPFELFPLGRTEPMLGMVLPIVRWAERDSDGGERTVKKIACIRPTYTANPLPAAALEEADLKERFGDIALAASRADLDALIGRDDIDLVHFAGHAQHNPAKLKIGDADSIQPQYFSDRPLTKCAPFIFVNGCEAGRSASGVMAAKGNIMVALIGCPFSGVVAPLITVDSVAARVAARTFYDAVASGKSVAEAVRLIRALAGAQPDKAGTFLSYVCYAPPDLRLVLQQK